MKNVSRCCSCTSWKFSLLIHKLACVAALLSAPCLSSLVAGTDGPGSAFAGRWDLTIRQKDNSELPSWLEITFDRGSAQASFVGRWGNARPLPKVDIHDDGIMFVSPKEEEGSKTDLVFQGK